MIVIFLVSFFEYNGYVRFSESASLSVDVDITPSDDGFSYSWWSQEDYQNYSNGLSLSIKTERANQEVSYFWTKTWFGSNLNAGSDVSNGGSMTKN